jgi:hypothetical protein
MNGNAAANEEPENCFTKAVVVRAPLRIVGSRRTSETRFPPWNGFG